MTLILPPLEVSTLNAMSPLVDFVGRAITMPASRTSLPSVDSPGPDGERSTASGTDPLPSSVRPVAVGRISNCPYGSASAPDTTIAWPRVGPTRPSGNLTTIPPVASPIARRDGVPRRPASAVTTPRTVTAEPTGITRVAAIESPLGDALGNGEPVGDEVGLAEGSAVGGGSGVGDGAGVGAGVGGGLTTSSLAMVTYSR